MEVTEVRRQTFQDFEGNTREEFLFFFTGTFEETLLPGKKGPFFLCLKKDPITLVDGDPKPKKALLSARVTKGTMRYFFPDPENYWYLPAEDRAIHKSVAEFLPKSRRKKATPQTAYERCEGVFLPVPPEEEAFHKELFRLSRNAFPAYIRLSDAPPDPAFLLRYCTLSLKLFTPALSRP